MSKFYKDDPDIIDLYPDKTYEPSYRRDVLPTNWQELKKFIRDNEQPITSSAKLLGGVASVMAISSILNHLTKE